MIRSTIYQLGSSPSVPGIITKAIARQPGILGMALQRAAFATRKSNDHRGPSVQKTTTNQQQQKQPEASRSHRSSIRKHPFWDGNDWFLHPHDFHDPFSDDFFLERNVWERPWWSPLSSRQPGLTALHSTPGYSWKVLEDRIDLTVPIPQGINAKVEVDDESGQIHIHGTQSDESPHSYTELEVDHRFALPESVDLDGISASSLDGVLKVTIPTTKKTKRSIPIQQGIPSEEEVIQETYSDEFDESDWAESGKQVA